MLVLLNQLLPRCYIAATQMLHIYTDAGSSEPAAEEEEGNVGVPSNPQIDMAALKVVSVKRC